MPQEPSFWKSNTGEHCVIVHKSLEIQLLGFSVFSYPDSSIPTLVVVGDSLTDCHFRICTNKSDVQMKRRKDKFHTLAMF